MNWSKNLYVFMLGAIIVFSGCFGTGMSNGDEGDTDDAATSGTTIVNNYYNNTISSNGTQSNPSWYISGTTYHQCTPTTTVNHQNNASAPCVDDDETMADEWVMVKNYTIINQAPNTGIRVHSYSAGVTTSQNRIGTICSNGAISGWGITPDNGEHYVNSMSISFDDGLLPYAGLDCNHYLFGQYHYQSNITVHWHVAYDVVNLLPGPH